MEFPAVLRVLLTFGLIFRSWILPLVCGTDGSHRPRRKKACMWDNARGPGSLGGPGSWYSHASGPRTGRRTPRAGTPTPPFEPGTPPLPAGNPPPFLHLFGKAHGARGPGSRGGPGSKGGSSNCGRFGRENTTSRVPPTSLDPSPLLSMWLRETKMSNVAPANRQNCVGGFLYKFWRIFPGHFPGGLFWALFSHKDEEKKSGDKIRDKVRQTRKQKYAKNLFCRKPALTDAQDQLVTASRGSSVKRETAQCHRAQSIHGCLRSHHHPASLLKTIKRPHNLLAVLFHFTPVSGDSLLSCRCHRQYWDLTKMSERDFFWPPNSDPRPRKIY